MIIVEIGIKLDKSIEYYDKMLRDNGATNLRNLETVDYYWTNKELCDMTENEMKNACIRFRMCKGIKTKKCLLADFKTIIYSEMIEKMNSNHPCMNYHKLKQNFTKMAMREFWKPINMTTSIASPA